MVGRARGRKWLSGIFPFLPCAADLAHGKGVLCHVPPIWHTAKGGHRSSWWRGGTSEGAVWRGMRAGCGGGAAGRAGRAAGRARAGESRRRVWRPARPFVVCHCASTWQSYCLPCAVGHAHGKHKPIQILNFSVVLFSISLGIQFAIIFHVTNVITFCYYIAKVIEKFMFYFVITIISCVSNS